MYDCSLILYKRSFGSPNSWKLGLLFFVFFFCFFFNLMISAKKGDNCLMLFLVVLKFTWLWLLPSLQRWLVSWLRPSLASVPLASSLLVCEPFWYLLAFGRRLPSWLASWRPISLHSVSLLRPSLLSDLVHWTKRLENFENSVMKILVEKKHCCLHTEYYVRCSQAAVVGTWIETDPFGTNRIQNNLLWTFTLWNLLR